LRTLIGCSDPRPSGYLRQRYKSEPCCPCLRRPPPTTGGQPTDSGVSAGSGPDGAVMR
jgi:hypothetical protein